MKTKFLAPVLFLSVISSAYSGQVFSGYTKISNTTLEDAEFNGSTEIKDVKAHNVKVSGSLTFENLEVKEKLKVGGSTNGKNLNAKNLNFQGSTKIENITADSFEASGSVKLKNANIKEIAKSHGHFEAKNSNFNNLEVSSDEITLKDTKVEGEVLIKKPGVFSVKHQVLKLEGKSEIMGNIVFESDKGKVYLDKNAKIHGKIEGGELIKK